MDWIYSLCCPVSFSNANWKFYIVSSLICLNSYLLTLFWVLTWKFSNIKIWPLWSDKPFSAERRWKLPILPYPKINYKQNRRWIYSSWEVYYLFSIKGFQQHLQLIFFMIIYKIVCLYLRMLLIELLYVSGILM